MDSRAEQGKREDREYVIQLSARQVARLRAWLEFPNGGLPLDRVTFEAVEGGGILVRSDPYRAGTP
jgi:hypothetical protein